MHAFIGKTLANLRLKKMEEGDNDENKEFCLVTNS